MNGVEVKHRANEHGEREDDDKTTDDAVDDLYAIHVELSPHLIYQPCQAVPPQQGTGDDAHVAKRHLQRMMWDDEGKLSVAGDEQKDNQRIREGHEKGSESIMPQCTFAMTALMHVFPWITFEAVDAKQQ